MGKSTPNLRFMNYYVRYHVSRVGTEGEERSYQKKVKETLEPLVYEVME